MGILTLPTEDENEERTILAGKPGRRKLRHRPRKRSGIGVLMRVITRPNQRTGLDVAETEALSLLPQIQKFFRLIEPGNGQMILGRAQILPDRQNVDPAGPQIAEDFDQ